MYIQKVKLQNFRSFGDEGISSVLSGYFANALLYEHAYLLTSGKDMLLTLLNVEMMIGR